MIHVRHQKMYRGQPAKTRLITSTVRVPVDWRPPATITKPENSRLHQGGSAGVFRFQPNPNLRCCKAMCMSRFVTADDDRVVKARQPLYNPLLSVDETRAQLRQNWKDVLLFDRDGQDRQVCLTCACKIYVCSRSKLCKRVLKSSKLSQIEKKAER